MRHQTANDIITFPVVPAKSKKYLNPIINLSTDSAEKVFPCKTRRLPVEEVEAQLSAQFGDKLKNKKEVN